MSPKLLKRSRHGRWQSIETLGSVIGERATQAVRRSLDGPWFGRSKHRTPLTSSQDAEEIAKIFDDMVCSP